MAKHHRLARLLEIITLIRSQRNLGPDDLAKHFGVSRKRIFDDIHELNIAGIPVFFGSNGYEIARGFFLPPVNLTTEEMLIALFGIEMVEKRCLLSHPKSARNLRSKLISGASEPLVEGYRELSAKIASPGRREPEQIAPDMFFQLTQAVKENRRILIQYRSLNSRKTTDREVDPYGIVYLKDSWYLTGFCWKNKAIRTFKIIRIEAIELLPMRTQAPQEFSLSEYYADSWGVYTGKSIEVKMRFSKKLAPIIREKHFIGAILEDRPGGSLVLTVQTRGLKEISWWIMQYGEEVEVLSPKRLRQMIAGRARKVVALYSIAQPSIR